MAGGITHSLFKLLAILECNLEGEGEGICKFIIMCTNKVIRLQYVTIRIVSQATPFLSLRRVWLARLTIRGDLYG